MFGTVYGMGDKYFSGHSVFSVGYDPIRRAALRPASIVVINCLDNRAVGLLVDHAFAGIGCKSPVG
jgi:hypothetical protein